MCNNRYKMLGDISRFVTAWSIKDQEVLVLSAVKGFRLGGICQMCLGII